MDLPPLNSQDIVRPGTYRHYKGQDYQVLATVRHSETGEAMVLYQALYGDSALWVRPSPMFLEDVEIDGLRQPRFSALPDDKSAASPSAP